MKTKIVYSLICLFIFSGCEAQPNRPLTVIDKVDKLASEPPVLTTPLPSSIPTNAQASAIVTAPSLPNSQDNKDIIKIQLKGTIYSIVTKKPLEKAKITIGNYSAVSDINGNFEIPNVLVGVYLLIVSKEGFIDYIDDNFNVKANFGGTAIFLAPNTTTSATS